MALTKEIVTSLPDLIVSLSSLSIWGWIALIIILILVFLGFFANRDITWILDVFERTRRRKLVLLESYISSSDSATDSDMLEIIQDVRNAHYFKIATGIFAEGYERKTLIKLHQRTSHVITWRKIRLALPHLDLSSPDTIIIKDFSRTTKFSYCYNKFVAYLFLIVAILLGALAILFGSQSFLVSILSLSSALVAGLFAVFMFSQNWPVDAAIELDNVLKNGEIRRVRPMCLFHWISQHLKRFKSCFSRKNSSK